MSRWRERNVHSQEKLYLVLFYQGVVYQCVYLLHLKRSRREEISYYATFRAFVEGIGVL